MIRDSWWMTDLYSKILCCVRHTTLLTPPPPATRFHTPHLEMEFLMRCFDEETFSADGLFLRNVEIQRCPFLRNITEPTNFSFSSPLSFTIPGAKGPIFEDGPNFDLAFNLFHGPDGVVPLSESAAELKQSQSVPQFNPLAARAATISLSSFGLGGPFGFEFFSKKWKKQKSNSEKKESKQRNSSSHEAAGSDWLETGNCPIAKSFRAVSAFVPLVAKVLQPPPGMKFRCPPAVIAARAALARTALVKNLRPQPLPAKMLAIAMLGMAVNVPLGVWREHTEKFSPSWFAAVHAAVPFIAMLRKSVLMPKTAMAFTIAASIIGQTIGSRAERLRLKKLAASQTPAIKVNARDAGKELVIGVNITTHCCEEAAHKLPSADGISKPLSSVAGVCY